LANCCWAQFFNFKFNKMDRELEIQIIINSIQEDVKRSVTKNYIHVDFLIEKGKLLEKYKNELIGIQENKINK